MWKSSLRVPGRKFAFVDCSSGPGAVLGGRSLWRRDSQSQHCFFFFFKCDMFSVVKEESITVMITSFIIRRCQLFHPSYSQISSQRAFWLLKMLLLWAKFCSSHWDILSYLRLHAHGEKQVTEAWKGKWRSFSALRRAMNRSEQGDVTETHMWEWGWCTLGGKSGMCLWRGGTWTTLWMETGASQAESVKALWAWRVPESKRMWGVFVVTRDVMRLGAKRSEFIKNQMMRQWKPTGKF